MHPIQKQLLEHRTGIVSYCTSNEIVLETIMEDAAARNVCILIEATANQVNQLGGYTGMCAKEFVAFVRKLAHRTGLDDRSLILGGDHLGPLLWQDEPEASAMEKAETLVTSYVEAGFTKIHLDTSMRLADDPAQGPPSTELIARRGARLASAAMNAWTRLYKADPHAQDLVFIIGSEVPVPGGSLGAERLAVTSPDNFTDTMQAYKSVFEEYGMQQVLSQVIGVVVQPGVEFSNRSVTRYNKSAVVGLAKCLKQFPGIVFEGHSTDYQSTENLAEMVHDGIRILKVGPELTFSLREGLLLLTFLETELIPEHKHSHFRSVLDDVMCRNPAHWEHYYRGTFSEQILDRIYSYSDRCRYYLGAAAVQSAAKKLYENLDQISIPPNILSQFFPFTRSGTEGLTSRELLKGYLRHGVLEKYQKATSVKENDEYENNKHELLV